MMRQLQGCAMPRQGRVGPITPSFTYSLGEDLRGDGEIKIGNARSKEGKSYNRYNTSRDESHF